MSSVVLAGSSSGTLTIAAPAVAGTNTLTLPASTGIITTCVVQTVNSQDGSHATGTTTDPNTPNTCLLYTSPSPRDRQKSRMPSSA